MPNSRILVVEDDPDISRMLQLYFNNQGYEVFSAARGGDALAHCRLQLPDLIVLDIMLPDMDGYAVCRALRTTTRTSHIPIIFLTQRDERRDRIAGLELGADDYITKPFDLEELRLRVQNSIRAHQRLNLTDPRTGLPSSRLIEEQLRQVIRRHDNWSLMLIGIEHIEAFREAYGFVATDELLRFLAQLLNEVVNEHGNGNDFVGHTSGDDFVLITAADRAEPIAQALSRRFRDEVGPHYHFLDLEQGGIRQPDGSLAPLMDLSMGIVSSSSHPFADIREITEVAAELRRADQEK